MWIVVIKEEDSDRPAIVLRRSRLSSVADWIRKRTRTRVMIDWSDEMLETVRSDYRKYSAEAIAAALSAETKQNVTKNAVISKAHAIGLGKRRNAEG